MILSRRSALFGLFAAPAIVAAPTLMRVSSPFVAPPPVSFSELVTATIRAHPNRIWANVMANNSILSKVRERPEFFLASHDFMEAFEEAKRG